MIQMDEAARALDGTALKLYVRLLGLGVGQRTRTLDISDRWLCAEVAISFEALTRAKRQIERFVGVDSSKGVITKYALPLPWLPAQRPLVFSTSAPETRARCTDFQSTGAPENGAECTGNQSTVHRFPEHGAPENGAECTGNQSTVHRFPEYGAPENGALERDGQDIASSRARADGEDESIDRSRDLSVVEVIDRIVCAKAVDNHQRGNARDLADNLYAYMQQWGPPDRDTQYPDEQILARCLAVAPLGQLTSLLNQMRTANTKPGASYAWFVATFAHRLRGVKSSMLREALRAAYHRQREQNGSFQQDTLDMVQSGLRKMA